MTLWLVFSRVISRSTWAHFGRNTSSFFFWTTSKKNFAGFCKIDFYLTNATVWENFFLKWLMINFFRTSIEKILVVFPKLISMCPKVPHWDQFLLKNSNILKFFWTLSWNCTAGVLKIDFYMFRETFWAKVSNFFCTLIEKKCPGALKTDFYASKWIFWSIFIVKTI